MRSSFGAAIKKIGFKNISCHVTIINSPLYSTLIYFVNFKK